jgi:heme/copper-type cytochrome/quinol oxidase subunit 2
VVHGFLITGTNINLMLVPGYVSSLKCVSRRQANA